MTPSSFTKRFARAIRYPEEISEGVRSYTFLVDGLEVEAEGLSRGGVLRFGLDCGEGQLVELAEYASGRLLREGAILSWDADRERAYLWVGVSDRLDDGEMCRVFEDFVDSCEWWLARCAEREVPRSVLPSIMIRP